MKQIRTIFTILILAFSVSVFAQDGNLSQSAQGAQVSNSRAYIMSNIERSAGFYHSYEVPNYDSSIKTRPRGYKPFYISHYARHGSRWHASQKKYEGTLRFYAIADSLNLLTEVGQRFYKDLQIIVADAQGHFGDLTPRGALEHKGIAHRMYNNYPEVFKKGAIVDSKSSIFVRCILSMAAFDEGLKEKEPRLNVSREASKRTMALLCHSRGSAGYGRELTSLADSLRRSWIATDDFMNRHFLDRGEFLQGKIRDEQSLMYDCFELAGIMQCCDYLDIDLYYIFSEDEIYSLWKYLNAYAYSLFGPAKKYGDSHLEDAEGLLRNIVETADNVVNGVDSTSASLRFGHDSNIIPLVSLIGIAPSSSRVKVEEVTGNWNISKVSPMAANLQFVFFRNRKGDVKVRVLYNEIDAQLPIEGAPFYDWDVLKNYLKTKY